jgi:multidrug efflux pump subunit AcrA (membrane-fusion protein)
VKRRAWLWSAAGLVIIAVASPFLFAVPSLPDSGTGLPTTRIVRGPLKLTVYATGEVRAGRTATLVVPQAGGTLRLVTLVPTGTNVKAGDVVFEIDPADQQFALEQAKSELAEAEQQIVKTKADSAVQTAEDALALLTARFDVRRGELDIAANDLIGAIEAQKNVLTLDEARHRLSQLELDVKSRSATNEAALAVLLEQRNKAQLAIQRAQAIIDSLVVKATFDGVVAAKENRDAAGGFFFGQSLPEYRQGDTTFSGRAIADVIETGKMEVRAKINETDRDNLQAGQTAVVESDAVPGQSFAARVGALSGLASRGNFFETSAVRQFDVTFTFDKIDPRLLAGSTVRLVIDGRVVPAALQVPRQSVFEKNGKTFVYLKTGDRFERRDVKVTDSTESRAVVTGVNEGDVIALIDPEIAAKRSKSSSSSPLPAAGSAK